MKEHFVDCRGLKVHLIEEGEKNNPTILLHHGFLDHARSWDPVAESLAQTYRVLALDARGHGDSEWVHGGGYYYFQDYVFDIAEVVDRLADGGPIILVGHSMGGMACSLFAGTFPEQVRALISIEGAGPHNFKPSIAPILTAKWISGVREAMANPDAGAMADVAEAAARLRANNPRLSPAFALHLAEHGTRKISSEGKILWKFDPVHRSRSPQPYYLEQARAFWLRTTAPTLLVQGEQSPFNWPEEENRENIPNARRVVIPGAGHMVHHDQPERLAQAIHAFLAPLP